MAGDEFNGFCRVLYGLLGGGSKYFSFSPLFGEDSHFDSYFSKGVETTNEVISEAPEAGGFFFSTSCTSPRSVNLTNRPNLIDQRLESCDFWNGRCVDIRTIFCLPSLPQTSSCK